MKLESSAFSEGQPIPTRYTCQGEGTNPPLSISAVPNNAQSLALIMHDPDAPVGDFTHWVLWNIDPDTEDIHEGEMPTGASTGVTDFGHDGYGGPCPPSGTHRYIYELYALDTELPTTLVNRFDLEAAMEGHTVAEAQLIGTYERK
jgi:Raf kinase inhibitor-like YbhB/YbcL family protein